MDCVLLTKPILHYIAAHLQKNIKISIGLQHNYIHNVLLFSSFFSLLLFPTYLCVIKSFSSGLTALKTEHSHPLQTLSLVGFLEMARYVKLKN